MSDEDSVAAGGGSGDKEGQKKKQLYNSRQMFENPLKGLAIDVDGLS